MTVTIATPAATIRPLRDQDAAGLIALIGAIWLSYPGIVFDVDAELPELKALASARAAQGGCGGVAERAGRVVGSAAVAPLAQPGTAELMKLYVAPQERRQGLARRLLGRAEDWAAARGLRRMVLWSDTRFVEAHAFYLAHGYRQTGTRQLQDLSCTVEFGFERALG